ncbi:MAG: transposase [Gemmatimonadetes bacterium]|nr:transposase [Gemmatimonadota bacterium]
MPWKETAPTEERLQFVRDALSDRFTMSERCARYGVSRRIGYKWLARYDTDGRRGLTDRSRAPHHCPHKIAEAMAELLVTAREAHPFWGARKLLTVLAARHPRIHDWPAPSTVAPNDLWTADFKGQFRTGDRTYCYPLTIADQHTRFLLACRGLLSTHTVTARPVFERAFHEHGLPFATQAIHGLSYLNVWWMR